MLPDRLHERGFTTSLFLSFLPSNFVISLYSSRWWGSDFSRWDISRYGNCCAPLIWLLYLSLLHFLLLLSVLACVTFPAWISHVFFRALPLPVSSHLLKISSNVTSSLLCYSVFSPWRWCREHLKTCVINPRLWNIIWSLFKCCYSDRSLAIEFGCCHCWHFFLPFIKCYSSADFALWIHIRKHTPTHIHTHWVI